MHVFPCNFEIFLWENFNQVLVDGHDVLLVIHYWDKIDRSTDSRDLRVSNIQSELGFLLPSEKTAVEERKNIKRNYQSKTRSSKAAYSK